MKKFDAHDTILTPSDPSYPNASATGYPSDTNPTRGATLISG